MPKVDAKGLGELKVGRPSRPPTTRPWPASLTCCAIASPAWRTSTAPPRKATSWSSTSSASWAASRSRARGQGSDARARRRSLHPRFEEQVVGLKAGEEKVITVTFPEDYSAEHLAGQEATFDITLHDVKAKQLPELDDEFALEVGGVDTLAELKADIQGRINESEEQRIEQLFRLATLDAAAIKLGVEIPDALAYEHAHQEFHRMMHRFEHQGISQEIYLQSVGKTHDEVVQEAVPGAVQQLKRQAVVSAVVEAEGLSATDEEIEEAVAPLAAQEKITVKKAMARLQSRGQIDALRQDLAEQKAVDLLVERAEAITVAAAKKAKTAYTPSREEQAENPGLWTL